MKQEYRESRCLLLGNSLNNDRLENAEGLNHAFRSRNNALVATGSYLSKDQGPNGYA